MEEVEGEQLAISCTRADAINLNGQSSWLIQVFSRINQTRLPSPAVIWTEVVKHYIFIFLNQLNIYKYISSPCIPGHSDHPLNLS